MPPARFVRPTEPAPRVDWDSELETDLWADLCQNNFWHFTKECYGIDHHPKGGWLSEGIHKPLCDWYQQHVMDWLRHRNDEIPKQKNLFVVIFREGGKTHIITRAGSAWLCLQDPELAGAIGSETDIQAMEFVRPIGDLWKGNDPHQRWTEFYGNWHNPERTWRRDSLVHAARRGVATQEPSLVAFSVASGLTGMHPDFYVLDDPLSYEGMAANANLNNVVIDHVSSMIPVLKRNGLRVHVGTRYSDGDWISDQLRKHGARSVSGMPMPGVTPHPDGMYDVYFLAARDITGKPVLPSKWPEDALLQYEKDNNQRYWAQVMNAPGSSEHNKLTRKKVEELMVDRKDVPRNLRISMHGDTAFKSRNKQGRGDSTVLELWGHSRDGSGDVYFLEAYGSNRWRVEHFKSRFITLLQQLKGRGQWPFIYTEDAETGGHTGSWELVLQGWCHEVGLPCPQIELITRQGKAKEKRIAEATSYWVDGKVKLVRDAPGLDQLVDQMLAFDPWFDDYADAGADVFSKKVYTPQRLQNRTIQPIISMPYDDILRPTFNLQEQRSLFQRRQNNENEQVPPIGWDSD